MVIKPRDFSISAVVLTLNEELTLPRALSSLNWCNECIVLDSGSTDSTREVAERFGARFIVNRPTLPFRITDQRNWALNHASITSDWVFFIDADESIDDACKQQIISTISSPSFSAYEMTPRYIFLGKWLRFTQGYPNWHPRLLRRGSATFEGGVWESFSPGIPVGRLHAPYDHYAFSKGLDDWLERHLRYATWDATQIFQHHFDGRFTTINTGRKPVLRSIMLKLWFLRPPLRFFQKYILQFGFLEGWQGLLYALMISFYDLLTVIKVIELLRQKRNLPL